MKFTCDSCSAQYMISDEKVGPNGVKVRCKKCGNVIVVRRVAEAPAAAAPKAGANGAEKGLDVELGQAFDHAFGDTPPSTPAPSGTAPAPAAPVGGGDLASTQLMGSEDAAKVFASASSAAPPATTEWYVAIGQAQVGPLPLEEVKKKWELGDVGPDSLVWRPGMADWTSLTSVPDLAGYLAPVPRSAPQGSRAPHSPAPDATGAEGPPAPAPPAAEVSWKPAGASALAALASEEIASRSAPAPKPAARPAPSGAKSLVDALPDGGGVDPTGALPLNIKALETTGEKKIERRSSVAKGAQQVRQRRSTTRALTVGLVLGVVLVGGAGVGGFLLLKKTSALRALVSTVSPPPPAPSVAAPQPQPPVPPPPPLAPPAPEPKPAVAAAPAAPPAPAAEAHAAPPEKVERAERPGRRPKVARAEPPPPPAPRKDARREAHDAQPAAPEPTPKKKDLLDFEANDSALNEALGSGGAKSGGRSVYVPPRPAGGGALPEKVSPGDINAAVAQRIDSLRRCVSEQKTREPDATGTLKMRWIIQGDGNVRDVKCLTSEYATGPFATCIAGVVKSIKFPRSATTGQEVTFPFNF